MKIKFFSSDLWSGSGIRIQKLDLDPQIYWIRIHNLVIYNILQQNRTKWKMASALALVVFVLQQKKPEHTKMVGLRNPRNMHTWQRHVSIERKRDSERGMWFPNELFTFFQNVRKLCLCRSENIVSRLLTHIFRATMCCTIAQIAKKK
jgi:hypothetical protein